MRGHAYALNLEMTPRGTYRHMMTTRRHKGLDAIRETTIQAAAVLGKYWGLSLPKPRQPVFVVCTRQTHLGRCSVRRGGPSEVVATRLLHGESRDAGCTSSYDQ
jgi:hypothetical protein